MLTRDSFGEFFALLNGGHRPFAWQQRLLDHVLDTGRWPDEINAPTGSGKSSVVDVHVFANALYAVGHGPRVPRRLAVVVNRRALVDHHLLHAEAIAASLKEAQDGLLRDVSSALKSLTADASNAPSVSTADPLGCASLRGGVTPDREWISDPRTCAVIAATPDMWGSRVLFTAYGTSRRARPREAGLLVMDSVVVLDEAHLTRQLLVTAEIVGSLAQPSEVALGVPSLQVVATTATPSAAHAGASRVAIGVTPADLEGPGADEALVSRLTRPKPVNYQASPHVPTRGKANPPHIAELANLALALRAELPREGNRPRTVGCVVNHVDTASRLADHLRKELAESGDGNGEAVVCWVGRMRPMDLQRARQDHPGLFEVTGDPRVAFLVATQTVEVGIDLDLAGLVTELAPGSALAQRAGRVNRLGLRDSARVIVVGPSEEQITTRRPYEADELRAAYTWLERVRSAQDEGEVSADGSLGLAPVRLVGDLEPPRAALARPVLSRLTPADALRLAETSEPPFAEPDLAFWLRDDLAGEAGMASLVVRADLPLSDQSALALVEAAPPVAREMYPATVYDAKSAIERILASDADERARAFLVRGEETTLLTPEVADEFTVRSGDIMVVDVGHPLTLSGVVVADPPTPAEPVEAVWGDPETVVWFAERHASDLELLAEIAAEMEGEDLKIIARALSDAAYGMVGYRAEVTLAPEPLWEDGIPPWGVFRQPSHLLDDNETRQEWSLSSQKVPLAQHSEAVAQRAAQMAAGVGLLTNLQDAVCRGGLLHDAGKGDWRFQDERMRWDGKTPLAKSGELSAQDLRRRRGTGLLPRGWRHEQLSAAVAFDQPDLGSERDLVIRLVGTSHGHGRPFFPFGHDAYTPHGHAVATVEAVTTLFGNGSGWSDIFDATHRRYGVWGCAYLEAVLRSADCQVSQEGS